jgi:cytochrome c biogenesis protein CcmG/thiol:disulfide interchange protein DsbE
MFRFPRAIALSVAITLASATAFAGEVRPGEQLPAISLADWNGRAVDLAQLRGQIVVIDFWASWCDTCRAALPALDAISRRHPDLAVVAINIDKTRPPAERFLADHLPQTRMTLLRDPDGAVLARLGAAGMPALYVVDRAGVVRLAEAGYAENRLPAIEAMITQLLESEVETTASAAARRSE